MLEEGVKPPAPAGDGQDRPVDLAIQFEDLFHALRLAEENRRFDDRPVFSTRPPPHRGCG